jgi:hypothetical protein
MRFLVLLLSILQSCSLFLPDQLKEGCTGKLYVEKSKRGIIFSHPMNREMVESAAILTIRTGEEGREAGSSQIASPPFQWESDKKYLIEDEKLLPYLTYTLSFRGILESRGGIDYSGPESFLLSSSSTYSSSPAWEEILSLHHHNGESLIPCREFPHYTEGVDRASRIIITFASPVEELWRDLFTAQISSGPEISLLPSWSEDGLSCTLSFEAPPPWQYEGALSLPEKPLPFLFRCSGERERPLQWAETVIDGEIQRSGSFLQAEEGVERSITLNFTHSSFAELGAGDLLEAVGFSLHGGNGYLDLEEGEISRGEGGETSITYRGSFHDCDPLLMLRISVLPSLQESLGKSVSGNLSLTLNVEK